MTPSTDESILNVRELLQLQNVTIPLNQRPYKWTLKYVLKKASSLEESEIQNHGQEMLKVLQNDRDSGRAKEA